jgi:hypothetical protein
MCVLVGLWLPGAHIQMQASRAACLHGFCTIIPHEAHERVIGGAHRAAILRS